MGCILAVRPSGTNEYGHFRRAFPSGDPSGTVNKRQVQSSDEVQPAGRGRVERRGNRKGITDAWLAEQLQPYRIWPGMIPARQVRLRAS